jgi:2-keto-4-pentenoate hydratase
MQPVAPGDTFTATFSGLGSVTARFAAETPQDPSGSDKESRA